MIKLGVKIAFRGDTSERQQGCRPGVPRGQNGAAPQRRPGISITGRWHPTRSARITPRWTRPC